MAKIYQIPFAYERYGRMEVKIEDSETLKDAVEKARVQLKVMSLSEMEALTEYLPDSEEIDEDGIAILEDGSFADLCGI